MKRIFGFLLLASLAFGVTSCQEEEKSSGYNWGTMEYYEDFLWKKHEPVQMKRTLSFELNEDAKKFFAEDDCWMSFKVTTTEDKTPQHVKVYFNGEKCDNYEFKVRPNGNTVTGELGIVLLDSAPEGEHELKIKYVGCNPVYSVDLDGKEIWVSADDLKCDNVTGVGVSDCICVEKIVVANSLKVAVTWGIIIFVVMVILWLLVVRRLIHRPISLNRLQFVGPDNFGGVVRTRGYYRVVLTNKVQKQGFFHQFFHGKIKYIQHPVWDSDITLMYRNSKSVRIRTTGDWTCDSSALQKNNTYKISNMTTKESGEITV